MILAASSPFISAYAQSDWFGKLIFLTLFLLSIVSWCVILYKSWVFFQVRRLSEELKNQFSEKNPLSLQFNRSFKSNGLPIPHPFFEIYKTGKQTVLQMISRQHEFSPDLDPFIPMEDLELMNIELEMTSSVQYKNLENHLFILSTTVTLAPFLGLLGTVWGILLTFSNFQQQGAQLSSSSMLAGLALALATTVVGLLVAIPALIGYTYLKNTAKQYKKEMDYFSHRLFIAIERHYRKPEYEKSVQISS